MINCLNCNQPITSKTAKKFCCKSCSATYTNKLRLPRSEESKEKTSKKLKGKSNPSAKNPMTHPKWCGIRFHFCSNCNKPMSDPSRATCSNECRDAIRSQNGTLKRRLPYKSFIFQSSWEVEIAKFLDQQNIIWTQPNKRIKWFDVTLQKDRTYLPDFYLTDFDFYLDVKNPIKQKQDSNKIFQLTSIMKLFVGNREEVKKFVVEMKGLEPPSC